MVEFILSLEQHLIMLLPFPIYYELLLLHTNEPGDDHQYPNLKFLDHNDYIQPFTFVYEVQSEYLAAKLTHLKVTLNFTVYFDHLYFTLVDSLILKIALLILNFHQLPKLLKAYHSLDISLSVIPRNCFDQLVEEFHSRLMMINLKFNLPRPFCFHHFACTLAFAVQVCHQNYPLELNFCVQLKSILVEFHFNCKTHQHMTYLKQSSY